MVCYLNKEINMEELDNGHKGHWCSTCKNSKGLALGCSKCKEAKACCYIKRD